MCRPTKFYQNRRGFVEDMTKTFGVFFSIHSACSVGLALFVSTLLTVKKSDSVKNYTELL